MATLDLKSDRQHITFQTWINNHGVIKMFQQVKWSNQVLSINILQIIAQPQGPFSDIQLTIEATKKGLTNAWFRTEQN